MSSGAYFEAREVYTTALAIDKTNKATNVTLLYNRSSANFKLGRFKDAIADCSEVLKSNETHIKALKRRAQSHYKLREFDDCIIDSEEAQRLEPSEEMRKLIEDASFNILVQKSKDNYEILGIPRSASKADIKKAFYKLSLQYHPDKNPGTTAIDKKKLEKKFQEITKAYNIVMSCCD
jgi:DnaJ homolog subfamily C member 7